jgi:hypothetical protein
LVRLIAARTSLNGVLPPADGIKPPGRENMEHSWYRAAS